MIPQTQIGGRPGAQHGDCFETCVASVLDLERPEVPYFMDLPNWWQEFRKWLFARGLDCAALELMVQGDRIVDAPKGYWIGSGKSPFGPHNHAVVMLGQDIAHDPDPRGAGLDGPPRFGYRIYQAITIQATP